MPYIPKNHKKYNILPLLSSIGGEVFSYPSEELEELNRYAFSKQNFYPYSYESYDDYYNFIFESAQKFRKNEKIYKSFEEFIVKMKKMNIKENWSIVTYLGDNCIGLTHGQNYYWPCSGDNPVYEGVIDNEEFTSYLYSIDSRLWQIQEDPTGMAAIVLNDGGIGSA